MSKAIIDIPEAINVTGRRGRSFYALEAPPAADLGYEGDGAVDVLTGAVYVRGAVAWTETGENFFAGALAAGELAAEKADAAAGSADAAAGSENAAADSAAAAAASALAAAGSENAAADSAGAAAGSAGAAATSEANAGDSEAAAAASAAAADDDATQTAADVLSTESNLASTVAAKDLAVAARTGAETAKSGADATKAAMDVALAAVTDYSDTLGLLSGGAKEIAAAADVVAVFVYDTTRDSDGGAWRKRCRHTSWYNETLSTATRGARREFPQKALIVARATSLTVYDLDTANCPMWGVAPSTVITSLTSIVAMNGKLIVGAGTSKYVAIFDFINQRWRVHTTSGRTTYSGTTLSTLGSSVEVVASGAIINNSVSAVAATVLPGTPIDPVRGLPNPTVAVGTAGGVSVIHWDGRVTSSSSTTAVTRVSLLDDGLLTALTSTQLRLARPSVYGLASFAFEDLTVSTIPALLGLPAVLSGDIVASTAGLSRLSRAGFISRSAVAHITNAYNTGHMVGDIKLALAASTADLTSLVEASGHVATDRSAAANHATVKGTITRAAVASGAELAAYGGFSAANYLEVPYTSAFSFGTADFAICAWLNLAANSAIETIVERDSGTTAQRWTLQVSAAGLPQWIVDDGTTTVTSAGTVAIDDARWHFVVAARRGANQELWIDGALVDSDTAPTLTLDNASAALRVGESVAGGAPLTNGSLALLRIGATAPTPAQIRAIYEDERRLFEASAKCLLPGASVSALTYDDSTDLLHVATTAGSARMRGLLVVDKDATVYTGIDARDGILATRDSGSADIVLPSIPLREAAAAGIGHNGGPALYDRRTARATGVTTNATPTVIARFPMDKGEFGQWVIRTTAREYDGGAELAAYEDVLLARRPGEGNLAISGSVTQRVVQEVTSSMAVSIAANITTQCIEVTATGVAVKNIEWTVEGRLV